MTSTSTAAASNDGVGPNDDHSTSALPPGETTDANDSGRTSGETTGGSGGGSPATVVEYDDDHSIFPNPERGWMVQGPPYGNFTVSADALTAFREQDNAPTLIRKYYVILDYLDEPLPPSVLDEFASDAEACRSAGMKLVPRFAYGMGGQNDSEEDATLSRTLEHLEQLRPVFEANADVVATLQAGFVGPWGEWHHSSNEHVETGVNRLLDGGLAIRDKLLEVVPPTRTVSVRYMYWHKIAFWPEPVSASEAFDPTLVPARLGYHIDEVSAAPSWRAPGCGECPAYEEMLSYRAEDTKWVPLSGEVCPIYSEHYREDPRPELASVHFSMLVDDDCGDVLDYWRQQGWYEDLSRHLGYRFSLDRAEISATAPPGGAFELVLELENQGYAAPFNPRALEIVMRDPETGAEHTVDLSEAGNEAQDPRFWLPGPHRLELTVPVPADLRSGRYALLLNLPDPAPSLRSNPRFSIRLANDGIWEPTTGYNHLNAELVVAP